MKARAGLSDAAIGFALVLIFVTFGGFVIWWEHRHPCVRYEAATCRECTFTAMLPDGDGNLTIPMCMSWKSVPCQVCAERAP